MVERYRLRPAALADSAALAALEAASFSDPWTLSQLETALEDEAVTATIAEAPDAEVVGYVMSRTVADEGEILTITSAPAVRRRGIGRSLLDHALEGMTRQGARTAWLEVRRSNAAAREMYLRAGFVEAGIRRNYYRDPVEDALIMLLQLPASGRAPEQ